MRNSFVKLAVKGALVLSLGTVGAAFAQLVSPGPFGPDACPQCRTVDLSCPGSPCTCSFNVLSNSYVCQLVR